MKELRRIYNAFIYSIAGIKVAWKNEAALRSEIYLAAFLTAIAILVAPDKISLILMISSIILVIALEFVNTAIEAVTDYIGKTIHPLAKIAKDTGSAAVFIAMMNVLIVWSIILFL